MCTPVLLHCDVRLFISLGHEPCLKPCGYAVCLISSHLHILRARFDFLLFFATVCSIVIFLYANVCFYRDFCAYFTLYQKD